MKCSTSTIELETVISRIRNGTLNLQPDFQRGEVWSLAKQKRLIDTILRRWKIPPIHVITSDYNDLMDNYVFEEVLDGQQRLVAIRDFCNGLFPIDGRIKPYDSAIYDLHGCYFDDLPDRVKLVFLRYEIDFIRLTDFKPSEPAELFDRLNQPLKLTSSEQRNAYIGETRNQIKELVNFFEEAGASRETIGFSNSRLAYDEIIAKFCYAIELRTLRQKIIASDISDKYREDIAFSSGSIDECHYVLGKFMKIVNRNSDYYRIKMNKATIYSWFIFIKKNSSLSVSDLSSIMYSFEIFRDYYKGKQVDLSIIEKILYNESVKSYMHLIYMESIMNIFNQRASMGSTDVSSIIYRDIILHIFSRLVLHDYNNKVFVDFERNAEKGTAYALDYIYDVYGWGEKF